MSRILVKPEQLYAVSTDSTGFWLGGRASMSTIPWSSLRGCHLYARTEMDLYRMLGDATSAGYMILDGYVSERRGLRGFAVGLGAWGSRGKVECRGLDAWNLQPDLPDRPEDEVDVPGWESELGRALGEAETELRATCNALNEGRVPFGATAQRWVRQVYRRLGAPLEPEGGTTPLPADVAELCRRAHVGGPIVHARSSLSNWVSLDRDRAFGSAMLNPLPTGSPVDIALMGLGLHRWKPGDLMDAVGFAKASVSIPSGPLCPLLPFHRPSRRVERSRTLYPTGVFSGEWTLAELAQLERSGMGVVTQLHAVYTFEAAPVFRPVVKYIRDTCTGLVVGSKRLEHLLYGSCARGSGVARLASAPKHRLPLARDCFDDRTLRRAVGPAKVKTFPLKDAAVQARHALLEGKLQVHGSDFGVLDRPDRAAWITAQNRVEMAKLIVGFDAALKPGRSGAYVGRIYVDGIDIEARPEQLPEWPGTSIVGHGTSARLYRASAYARTWHDGKVEVEGGAWTDGQACEDDLRAALRMVPDAEGGPLAEGRAWPLVGAGRDARDRPGACSEPLHIDASLAARFGGDVFDVLDEPDEEEANIPG